MVLLIIFFKDLKLPWKSLGTRQDSHDYGANNVLKTLNCNIIYNSNEYSFLKT